MVPNHASKNRGRLGEEPPGLFLSPGSLNLLRRAAPSVAEDLIMISLTFWGVISQWPGNFHVTVELCRKHHF